MIQQPLIIKQKNPLIHGGRITNESEKSGNNYRDSEEHKLLKSS